MSRLNDKIILGTVQFGIDYGINNPNGKLSYNDSFKILDYAFKKGIRELDTASNYGNSEVVIGSYIKQNPKKIFRINTKISSKKKTLESHLKKSLENLSVHKINKLIFHSLDIYNYYKPYLEKFNFKNKGKYFDQIGVSVYDNTEVEFLLKEKNVDVIQAPFNLFDNYIHRGKIYKKIKSMGKTLDIRSIFLQGLFFMHEEEIPINLKSFSYPLLKLKKIEKQFDIDIQKIAYGYVNSFEFINQILIGVDCHEHLKKNLQDISFKIPENLKKEIEEIKIKHPDLLNPTNWKK